MHFQEFLDSCARKGAGLFLFGSFSLLLMFWGTVGSPLVSSGPSCAPLAPHFPFFWCPRGTCGSPLVSLGPSCAPLVPFFVSLAPSGVPLVSSQPPRSSTWPIGELLLDLPKERQSRARTPFSGNLRKSKCGKSISGGQKYISGGQKSISGSQKWISGGQKCNCGSQK